MDNFTRTLAAVELREHGVKRKDIESALPTENTAEEEKEDKKSRRRRSRKWRRNKGCPLN